jgi:hypothetical protein
MNDGDRRYVELDARSLYLFKAKYILHRGTDVLSELESMAKPCGAARLRNGSP